MIKPYYFPTNKLSYANLGQKNPNKSISIISRSSKAGINEVYTILRNHFNSSPLALETQTKNKGGFDNILQELFKNKPHNFVNQGGSSVSLYGKKLIKSDAFTACTPIIFFDALSSHTMLIHLDAGLCSETRSQWSQLELLPKGIYSVLIIKGDFTRQGLSTIEPKLTKIPNIVRIQEVNIPTKSNSFNILIDPIKKDVFVQTKSPSQEDYRISDLTELPISESEKRTLNDAFGTSFNDLRNLFYRS